MDLFKGHVIAAVLKKARTPAQVMKAGDIVCMDRHSGQFLYQIDLFIAKPCARIEGIFIGRDGFYLFSNDLKGFFKGDLPEASIAF